MRNHFVQTNFSSGEIDPRVWGRIDTAAYQNGARSMRNMALYNTGGAYRRPGTQFMVDFSTTATRIIDFEYDKDSLYIVALQNTVAKIYNPAGTLLATLSSAPWSTADLFEIRFCVLGATLILTHPDWAPQAILRTGASSFTLADFAFETGAVGDVRQPYFKYADPDVTMSVNATDVGATVTVTASESFFTSDYVGTIIRVHGSQIMIDAYTSATVVTGTILEKIEGLLDPNPFQTVVGDFRVKVTHVAHGLTTSDTITFQNASYIDMINSGFSGAGVISYVAADFNRSHAIDEVIDDDHYYIDLASLTSPTKTSPTAATEVVDGGGPAVRYDATVSPTRNWDEQVFSVTRGWPVACAFHERRLWFGGTVSEPSGLWSSAIDRYLNFRVDEGLDNESIQVALGSDQVSTIMHIVSNRHLQIFTRGGEYYCPQPRDSTLTPSNFSAQQQTPFGSADVRPLKFDGATLFVQSNLHGIREYVWADSDQSYQATLISMLSGHMVSHPTDAAPLRGSTNAGEMYAVYVKEDGTLAVFHSSRVEKLAGWTPWDLSNGTFYSVCELGGVLYFIEKYGTNYFMTKLAADDDSLLDLMNEYTGAAATVWAISSIYAAITSTVDVFDGDEYVGNFAISSNQITLPANRTSIQVGYAPTIEIDLLPPQVQLPGGRNNAGKRQRVPELYIYLLNTKNIKVGAKTLIAAAGQYLSYVKRFFTMGFSRTPSQSIRQTEPGKLRILYVKSKVTS